MNTFVITTDAACDLPEEYLAQHGVVAMSMNYIMDDVIYGNENKMDPKDFYNAMRTGKMPTTNAVNPEEAKECFLRYIKEGMAILHLGFSSGLSTSFNSARLAAEEICEEYPDACIYVVDTLAASLGEGLMVHKAIQLRDAGKSAQEAAAWLEENKQHFCHQFTVDDLFHLHRGGRVSKATAIVGTLINVKPVLHVDHEGHLISLCNVRGRKKALNKLVENMAEQIKGYEDQNDTVFISHGDCLEDAEYVANQIRDKFGIQDFVINYVSPVIGAHSGPGTVALFYMGSER